MAVHQLVLRYSPESWTAERQSPGASLRRVAEAVSETDALLCLFWPAEEDTIATVVVDDTLGARLQQPILAERIGATLESHSAAEFGEQLDSMGIQRANEIAMAMPAPGWRCLGCGKQEPPHYDGCPYRIDSETVRLASRESALAR